MNKQPAEWAWKRMNELSEKESEHGLPNGGFNRDFEPARAFARYIETHEDTPEPEVDSLLIEAREICASTLEQEMGWTGDNAETYRSGNGDGRPGLKAVLAALNRGMELATTQPDDRKGADA